MYKNKVYSYEDLEQTVWYILLTGLAKFDGRGDERLFILSFIRYKLISILKYNRKPPHCGDNPFTPLCMDYISADDVHTEYFVKVHGEYD